MTFVKSKRTDIELYPFQAEDCDYLEDRKSVLLAWEMGTGKTYAAIELDLRHRLERTQDDLRTLPTLVVAPLSTLATVSLSSSDMSPNPSADTFGHLSMMHYLFDNVRWCPIIPADSVLIAFDPHIQLIL